MKFALKTFIVVYLSGFGFYIHAQDYTFIPFGSEWKYLDDGSNQGTAWRAPAFNDSNWESGFAELGYGDGDENTIVSFGPDEENKYITTYFRHSFQISNVSSYLNFLIKLRRDDGALVYVNGNEAMRSNLGTDTYAYDDPADGTSFSEGEDIGYQEIIPASFFQNGTNVVAVEVHQESASSSDMSFDFELIGLDANPSIYREPYLQSGTPTSIIIKWVTDIPTESRVKYGNAPGNLTNIVDQSALTMNHEVKITSLQANTTYYYSVGTETEEMAGDDLTYYFTTSPAAGTSEPARIWVIGDSGRGSDDQRRVRDSYLNFVGQEKADIWMMLGDNAYVHGRDSEYHAGLFKDMYEPVLRNTVLWPIAGNHDYYSGASASSQSGTYYDVFALPKNGEAGGVSSGTEAYYSFDYGNIHFVGLDSYDTDRDSAAAMGQWLKEDLENTSADWLIAFWHYPPYTKGNHDSDDSGTCTEMRENFLPILERYGVDLVLTGHSHVYERSYLIDGHYGYSDTFNASMMINGSSGKMDLNEAYTKPHSLSANKGTVYAVCGVAGLTDNLESVHPVMFFATDEYYGSMIIDIYGDTLEAKFINDEGLVVDYFHIIKEMGVGVKNNYAHEDFKIMPNPAANHFTASYAPKAPIEKNVQVQIYSMNGIMVKQEKLALNSSGLFSSKIDTQDLNSGIYTLKLILDGNFGGSRLLVVAHE